MMRGKRDLVKEWCCLKRGLKTLICSLWSITNNPEYGNCFTFNADYNKGKDVHEAREVTMTGGSAAMSIVLYLNQLFYTPLSLTKKAGARITIHNPKVFPMTEEYGMNLKPNTASSIGFQQVLFKCHAPLHPTNNYPNFPSACHIEKSRTLHIQLHIEVARN